MPNSSHLSDSPDSSAAHSLICPLCHHQTVKPVEIFVEHFYICGHCQSTFLPANQLLQVDRKIFIAAKKEWRTALKSSKDPEAPQYCLLHSDQGVEREKIPGHSHFTHISTCCQLLHLTPSEWSEVLAITEKMGDDFTSSYKVHARWNPFRIIFDAFKNSSSNDEGLETLQFKQKIAPLLQCEEGP